MNGQDPNQNLNNMTPGGVDANSQNPVPTPAADPNAVPVQAAPVMPDAASVMPQTPAVPAQDPMVAPVAQTIPDATQVAAPVMPDAASVMPQATAVPAQDSMAAPVAQTVPDTSVMANPAQAVMPDTTQVAAPVMPDATSVMPQTPAAPVQDPMALQNAQSTPEVNGQAPVAVAPVADSNAGIQAAPEGGETPVKKGIAIDKNIIIIVVGIVIIIAVLLFAWKSGLIFSSKKPVTPPAANNTVDDGNNNNTLVEPEKKPQNTKEAKQKMDNMPWFLELVQMRYSELDSSKDILEDPDNMLFIAYEIYKEANSTKGEVITSSTCNIDAEALEIAEINNVLNTIFDDGIVNRHLTNTTYKVYTKTEYDKLKSSMACSSAKTCSDSKNCKVTDSYVLFETSDDTRENVAKYEDLSYENKELTGKLVLSYENSTKEGTFTIAFDDDELIKSIEIEK